MKSFIPDEKRISGQLVNDPNKKLFAPHGACKALVSNLLVSPMNN